MGSSTTSSPSRARSSPTARSGSGRGGGTQRRSSTSILRSRRRSRSRPTRRLGSAATWSSRSRGGKRKQRTKTGRRWIPCKPPENALREEEATLRENEIASQELDHALAFAYRYLSRRERTVAETRAHLLGKSVDMRAADSAVE